VLKSGKKVWEQITVEDEAEKMKVPYKRGRMLIVRTLLLLLLLLLLCARRVCAVYCLVHSTSSAKPDASGGGVCTCVRACVRCVCGAAAISFDMVTVQVAPAAPHR
jgi:hypothetical protein